MADGIYSVLVKPLSVGFGRLRKQRPDIWRVDRAGSDCGVDLARQKLTRQVAVIDVLHV